MLIQNNQDGDALSQEKPFKTAIAVDAIYEAQHGKYISEIHLITLAIKYSITQSKKIISIDNYITSSRSYYQF